MQNQVILISSVSFSRRDSAWPKLKRKPEMQYKKQKSLPEISPRVGLRGSIEMRSSAVSEPVTSGQLLSKGRSFQALRQKTPTFQHLQHNREEVKNA